MSNHSIIISSSLCKDTFPENHGGEFSNYLNRSLEFDDPNEQWSVALSEIVYTPDSWMNVRDGFNEIKVSMRDFHVNGGFAIIYYDLLEIRADPHEIDDYDEMLVRLRDDTKEVIADHDTMEAMNTGARHPSQYTYQFSFYNIAKEKNIMGGNKFDLLYSTIYYTHRAYMLPVVRGRVHFPTMEEIEQKKFKKPAILTIDGKEYEKAHWKKSPTKKYSMKVKINGQQILRDDVYMSCPVPPSKYPTTESLLATITDEINKTIKLLFKKYNATSMYDNVTYRGKYMWLSLVSESYQLGAHKFASLTWADPLFNIGVKVNIYLSKELQFQIGYTEYPMLDLGAIGISNITYYAPHSPDIYRNTLKSLWVFCDLAQPSFIGSGTKPLLRFLPVDTSTHQISYEVVSLLQFKPIARSSVDTIKIWFAEDFRAIPMWMSGDSHVRLEFQRL